jgi:chemotaxis protein CheX
MNVKFINPFLDAAHDVLIAEANFKTSRGELKLATEPYVSEDVTVVLSLIGAVSGTVFYSMSEETAKMLSSAMMFETFHELNELAQSGIAELGNVITGQATMRLAKAGFEATISPPTLLIGSNAVLSTLDYPRLIVPLIHENHKVSIHVALRESLSTLKTSQIPVPQKPEL